MSIQPRNRKKRYPWDEVVPPVLQSQLPPIPSVSGRDVYIPPPPTHQGPWYKNPNLPGVLMSIGAALSQPPQLGQNTWGQIGQALGAGYNYLAQASAARQAQWEEAWKRAMEIEKLRMEQRKQLEEEKVQKEKLGYEGRRVATEEKKAGIQEMSAKAEAEYKEKLIGLRGKELEQEMAIHRDKLQVEKEKLDLMRQNGADAKALKEQELKIRQIQANAALLRAKAEVEKGQREGKVKTPEDIFQDPALYARVVGSLAAARMNADPNLMADPEGFDKALEGAKKDIISIYQSQKAGLGAQNAGTQNVGTTVQAKVTPQGVQIPTNLKEGDVVELVVPDEYKGTDLKKYHGLRRVYRGGRLVVE